MEEEQKIKAESEIEPGMKIVPNYSRSKDMGRSGKTQLCQKCKKQIPEEDWAEHMRLELLDPKYREDKVSELDRQANPMTAQGDQISSSIQQFKEKRHDIYGDENYAQEQHKLENQQEQVGN